MPAPGWPSETPRGSNEHMRRSWHLAVCQASRSLSLSTMPRRREAPNGLTAWLIVEAVSWTRSHGVTRLSLNFSSFAGLLADHQELPAWRRLQRRALLRLKDVLALQLDNLLQFNGQFDPAWQPRYVILQAWADLPRMALTARAGRRIGTSSSAPQRGDSCLFPMLLPRVLA